MKDKYLFKNCKHHGNTEYVLEPSRNAYRCKKCRMESVSQRRKNKKLKLIKEFGGKCKICNYDKCDRALEFHHINPKKKSFGICYKGNIGKPYNELLEEAKKCILVCANCHREIEAGLKIISNS